MSNDADRPLRYVNPRPEVVKTLGILNIVVSILISMCATLTTGWFLLALVVTPKTVEVPLPSPPVVAVTPSPAPTVTKVETSTPPADDSASATVPAPAPQSIVSSTMTVSPMMGMDDPAFVQFCIIDLVTALVINLAMFVSGIGLVRLKRWGMLWSNWTSVIKIARLVALWVGFIVFVAPPLSIGVAKILVKIMTSSNPKGPVPDVKMLTNVYMITYSVMAVVVILIGVIYPVIALVVATRAGFRAAVRRDSSMNLPMTDLA